MKNRLILLLALLIPVLGQSQTKTYQEYQKRTGRVALYRWAERNTTTYPPGSGDAAFIAGIDNGSVPTLDRIGPSWLSAKLTYNLNKKYLEIWAANKAPIQLRFRYKSGANLTGSNPDGVNITGGQYYGPGPLNNQGIYTQQWTVGKNTDGTGGIESVAMALDFINTATGEVYTANVTPMDRSSQAQIAVAGNSSPPGPTLVTLATAYHYDYGSKGYSAYVAAPDGETYEAKLTPLTGQSGGLNQNWVAMSTGTFTIAGNAMNRVLNYPPGFAGGTDVLPGQYRQEIRKMGTTAVLASAIFTLSGVNSEGFQAGGTSGGNNNCDFTVSATGSTVNCGATGAVNAYVTGSGTNSVSFNWTGLGLTSSSGQNTSAAPPTSNGTYSYVVTGSKTGCANQSATTTITVNGCGTSSSTFARVLVLGNSITYRPSDPDPSVGWSQNNGMAASSLATDNAHLIETALKTKNPALDLYATGNAAFFEQNYLTWNSSDYNTFITTPVVSHFGGNKIDLLILSISENINSGAFNEITFRAKLDVLIASVPLTSTPTIIIRNSFWSGNDNSNAVLQSYASQKGYKFVDLSGIRERTDYKASSFSDPGVAHHPNDAGHAAIAALFLNQLGITPVSNVPTAGYGGIYAANSTYTELGETGRTGSNEAGGEFNRQYIDNGTLKLGVNLKAGAFLDFVAWRDLYGGQNIVNSLIQGGVLDAGRQWQWSWYAFPYGGGNPANAYTEAGQTTAHPGPDGVLTGGIGYNLVEGGAEGTDRDYALLRTMHLESGLIYTKASTKQWDLYNILGKATTEKWIRYDPGDGSAFRMHSRLKMYRDDAYSSHFPNPGGQEAPCFMNTAQFDKVYYCQGEAYTNNWVSVEPPQMGAATPFFSSEPFIIITDNSYPDRGICFYAPYSSRFSVNNDKRGSDNSLDYQDNIFYVASAPLMSLDPQGTYDFDIAVKYGTLSELRAWAYAQPRWTGAFDYQFNQKSRYGWLHHHAKDQLEANITDGMIVTPQTDEEGGFDMNASTPERWINGRTQKHIIIDASFAGGPGQMEIIWQNYDTNTEWRHTFSVTHDSTVRTYDIDMSGESNWNNKDIRAFHIQYLYNNRPSDISTAQWNIKRVRSGN